MKNLIFIFLFLSARIVFGQSAGQSYAITSDINLQRYDPFVNAIVNDAGKINQAKRGFIFTIRSRVTVGGSTGYNIVFWNFSSLTTDVTAATYLPVAAPAAAIGLVRHIIDKSDNDISFFISDNDLQAYTTADFRKPKGVFRIEGLILPIKLRFNNSQPGGEFDFVQSVSVGPAISFLRNYGGPFSKKSISGLVGFNVTNVSVDDRTAPGAVEAKTTLLALSPLIGVNFEYEGVTFSLLTGMDILTGKAGRVWAYRNSPWLGLSVGTSIFSTNAEKKQ